MNKNTAEHLSLADFYKNKDLMSLDERTGAMYAFVQGLENTKEYYYHRIVVSPSDREVEVFDTNTKKSTKMLMFGSNNYLGFANHPYVIGKVKEAIEKYGAGIGGPPLLNGNIRLKVELEERLADLKNQEDAVVFSSGYGTNLGLIDSLPQANDHIVFDEFSHASFYDGVKRKKTDSVSFAHNNMADLEKKLVQTRSSNNGEIYIGVEGVYSMDGDLAPLNQIVALAKKYNARILLV